MDIHINLVIWALLIAKISSEDANYVTLSFLVKGNYTWLNFFFDFQTLLASLVN